MVSHVNVVVFFTILIHYIVESSLHYTQIYLHTHRLNMDDRHASPDQHQTHTVHLFLVVFPLIIPNWRKQVTWPKHAAVFSALVKFLFKFSSTQLS